MHSSFHVFDTPLPPVDRFFYFHLFAIFDQFLTPTLLFIVKFICGMPLVVLYHGPANSTCTIDSIISTMKYFCTNFENLIWCVEPRCQSGHRRKPWLRSPDPIWVGVPPCQTIDLCTAQLYLAQDRWNRLKVDWGIPICWE